MSNAILSIPKLYLIVVTILALSFFISPVWAQTPSSNQSQVNVDPLPSWNNGDIKKNIIGFVTNATDPTNTKYYILPEDRIAVFDNDGTLWTKKPLYFQTYFLFDVVPEAVSNKPELKDKFLFSSILEKNFTALQNMSESDVMNLVMMTSANISQDEFNNLVHQWAQTAKHPETNRLFVQMVYQPMLELLNYLKANQFKNFIASGGGIDFIREALSSIYSIPADQIIGSSIKYQFIDKFSNTTQMQNNNKSFILRTAELDSIDDKYGKPANIQLHIGKVPVMAVGNSDGDLQMLEYATDNYDKGKSLEIVVHHDDPVREYSYDKGAENVLQRANERNWSIVSMADDFKEIYPRNGNNTG